MPRLLIACPVPTNPSVDATQEALSALGKKVTLLNTAYLHVALRSLGDVDESMIEPIKAALHSAVSKSAAFNAGVARMDALPTPKRPKVAVAMCGPMKTWRAMSDRIDEALEKIKGLPEREKVLLPNVALAQLKTGRGPQTRQHAVLGPRVVAIPGPKLNWRVKAVVLAQNESASGKAMFKPLMTCPLPKASEELA